MATTAAKRPAAIARVLEGLVERRDQLVEEWLERAVGRHGDAVPVDRLGDLPEAARLTMRVLTDVMCEGRALGKDDVVFLRPYIRHGMLRGASEADVLQAARLFQRVLWGAIVDLAGDTAQGRQAVLALAGPLIDYVEVMSDVAAGVYQEMTDALDVTADKVRLEVLEDLLAGRAPTDGPTRGLVRACGLWDAAQVIVTVAVLLDGPPGADAMALAATTLARAPGDALEPLAVVRGEEIVVVRAARGDEPTTFPEALDAARRRLHQDDVQLGIGVSAVHDGVGSIPAAYEEASLAAESARERGSVVALCSLGAFEYLLLRGTDRTAWHLVRPAIREFVAEDERDAGLLVETLLAYVDCDMNAKLAARRLYVHPNTAHYRLAKISERTGCDLRRLTDVMDLVVAIRLARRLRPQHRL